MRRSFMMLLWAGSMAALLVGAHGSAAQEQTLVTLTPLDVGVAETGVVEGQITCAAPRCGSFTIDLSFDRSLIRIQRAEIGPYLGDQVLESVNQVDNAAGTLRLAAESTVFPEGDTGNILFRLTVYGLKPGTANITVNAASVGGVSGEALLTSAQPTTVNVFETGKIAFFSPPANDWEVAFVSERDGNPEIYAVAADGSNPRRLTDNEAIDGEPAWSPDGSQIAFQTGRDGNFEIYVMDADGGNPRNLTNDAAPDTDPSWSPDGSQIGFVSERDSNPEVYVMAADGSNVSRLTDDPVLDGLPAWSPDGSQIAFISRRGGDSTEIYVMAADGSSPQPLTNLFGANGWYPAWSPTSQIMSLTVERDQNADIYTMDRTGENVQRLTEQSGWLTLTDWSPDGQWIVRMAGLSGNADLYVMSADGADLFRLTDDAAEDYAPDWRPPRAPSAPCVIRTDRDDVNVRVGPGDNRGVFTTLPRDQDFRVVGQAADDQGRIWWTLDKTQIPNSDVATSLWVNSEDVEERGDCFAAQVVEAPPIILGGPTPTPPGTWGGCGSCDTCGHPGECVISPDGQCLWDPATCHTGDVPPPPNCFSVTKQVRIDTAGIAASITLRPSPNCGSGYQPGTLITAVASSQCQFIGWSGSTCPVSGGQTASFTVTSSCVIVANFNC